MKISISHINVYTNVSSKIQNKNNIYIFFVLPFPFLFIKLRNSDVDAVINFGVGCCFNTLSIAANIVNIVNSIKVILHPNEKFG